MRISKQGRESQRGSAFVEMSLIFVVFACLLIGIVDFGQFLFVHQALVERARSAARWGAINGPSDTTSIQNMILYNQSDTPPTGTPAYFNLTSSNLTVSNLGSGTDNARLYVQISNYTYSTFTPFLSGLHSGAPITVSVPVGIYR